MSQFPLDERVAVRPIAHRREGRSVTIGDVGRQVFLTIPAEGLGILHALASGNTVREAARLYEHEHAEKPDIDNFLSTLAREGFVARWDDEAFRSELGAAPPPVADVLSARPRRRVLGACVLIACALVVGLALALVAADPGLLPRPATLVFHHDLAALILSLAVVALCGVMVHELGHLLVARARGVPAKIGIGHRLWVLVAETDMTGIWMASKRDRYLAFLAGPIVDAVSAALLVGVLWAERRGWIGMSPTIEQFTGAVLFSYLLRLLWQCFVFVRTDFYYVIATLLDCKSLLADTEDLLRNRWRRLRRSGRVVDQSAIPPAEMRAVRAYAVVWLGGRAAALASLALITLPVLTGYAAEIARVAAGGRSSYGALDLMAISLLVLGVQGAGFVVWIRSLRKGRAQRRNDELAQA